MRPGESQVGRKLHVTPEYGTRCHARVREGDRGSVVKEGLSVTVSGEVQMAMCGGRAPRDQEEREGLGGPVDGSRGSG